MSVGWRTAVLAAHVTLTGWLGAAFLLFPIVVACPLALLTPDVHCVLRAWADLWQGLYLAQFVPLIEWLFGTRLFIAGDLARMRPTQGAIVVCNHATRLDWMFLWLAWARFASLGQLKIVLKQELARAPMFGVVMSLFQFVYLRRRLDVDAAHIDNVLGYLATLPHAPQLLLFPEGTDRSAENAAKSRAYVLAAGKAPYAHVLAPRSAGFVRCVRAIGSQVAPILIDATIAYGEPHCQDEAAFLRGDVPRSVHLHTSSIPLGDLPRGERELADELERRWRVKDQQLAHFAAHGRFPGVKAEDNKPVALPISLQLVPLLWIGLSIFFVQLIFTNRAALAWFITSQFIFAAGLTGKLDLGAIERFWFFFATRAKVPTSPLFTDDERVMRRQAQRERAEAHHGSADS